MKTRQERIAWMHEQNWFPEWLRAMNDENIGRCHFSSDMTIDQFLQNGNDDEFISGAFYWDETRNGNSFWWNVHMKFKDFCGVAENGYWRISN